MKVKDVNFGTNPTTVLVRESRPVNNTRTVYVTEELSNALRGLSNGKSGDDSVLSYASFSEFHNDFRRAVRTARLTSFDLSDIKELFRAAAGSDYALLKQYESAQPFIPEDVRRAWLRVLPRLVVGV